AARHLAHRAAVTRARNIRRVELGEMAVERGEDGGAEKLLLRCVEAEDLRLGHLRPARDGGGRRARIAGQFELLGRRLQDAIRDRFGTAALAAPGRDWRGGQANDLLWR